MSWTTPPAALIFSSAIFDTNRALTIKGSWGSLNKGINAKPIGQTQLNLLSVAQNLSVAKLQGVNNRDELRVGSQILLLLSGHKTPELVDVDGWAPLGVASKMEMAHTNLSEVTGMVLVEVGSAEFKHGD